MTGFSGFSISTLKLSPISFKLKGRIPRCSPSSHQVPVFLRLHHDKDRLESFSTISDHLASLRSLHPAVAEKFSAGSAAEGKAVTRTFAKRFTIPFKRRSGPMGIRQTMPIGMSRKILNAFSIHVGGFSKRRCRITKTDLMRVLSGDFSKTFSW